jgi:hypothetical protein
MDIAERTHAEQELDETRQRIEQWRQTRTKLGPMPAPLWDDVAAVARRLGSFRVARALGLDYVAVKKRAFPAESAEARRQPRAGRRSARRAMFVEVKAAPSVRVPTPAAAAASEGGVVEVVAASGARLTIRLNGGAVGRELAALVASFR